MKPRGAPFKGKDDARRNNGGVPKEVRDLRALLVGDAPRVHSALMSAIDQGNVPAIIYAHTQLIGKPKERVEVSAGESEGGDSERPLEELLAIGLGALIARGG